MGLGCIIVFDSSGHSLSTDGGNSARAEVPLCSKFVVLESTPIGRQVVLWRVHDATCGACQLIFAKFDVVDRAIKRKDGSHSVSCVTLWLHQEGK